MASTRWQPAKPRTRIEVAECGSGHWDEQDHKLDLPHAIDTVDFRVTGTGHDRIERTYEEGCIIAAHEEMSQQYDALVKLRMRPTLHIAA